MARGLRYAASWQQGGRIDFFRVFDGHRYVVLRCGRKNLFKIEGMDFDAQNA